LQSADAVRHIDDFISITSPRDQWTHAAYRLPEVGCGEMTLHFDLNNNGKLPTTFYLDEDAIVAYQDLPHNELKPTPLAPFAPLATQPGDISLPQD
jgi:hypothetical protein